MCLVFIAWVYVKNIGKITFNAFMTITVLKNQILDHKDYTKKGNITWRVRLVHHLLNLKNLLVSIGCLK